MEDRRPEEWHWWRISFSTDDAKTQQAAKPENRRNKTNKTDNADVVGYSATKVREIEALRAARESRSLLLVYANNNAVDFPHNPAQPPLQVRKDASATKWSHKANDNLFRSSYIQTTLPFKRNLTLLPISSTAKKAQASRQTR